VGDGLNESVRKRGREECQKVYMHACERRGVGLSTDCTMFKALHSLKSINAYLSIMFVLLLFVV